MPGVTFDTSIFIAYKPAQLPAGFLMSAVLIQELINDVRKESSARLLPCSRIIFGEVSLVEQAYDLARIF